MMHEEEAKEFIIDLENEVYATTKKEFLNRTREMAEFAVGIFKKKFNYDEKKGLPRQWDRIEEGQIDVLYEKYEKEVRIYLYFTL
jgi:hypothetical protein